MKALLFVTSGTLALGNAVIGAVALVGGATGPGAQMLVCAAVCGAIALWAWEGDRG